MRRIAERGNLFQYILDRANFKLAQDAAMGIVRSGTAVDDVYRLSEVQKAYFRAAGPYPFRKEIPFMPQPHDRPCEAGLIRIAGRAGRPSELTNWLS